MIRWFLGVSLVAILVFGLGLWVNSGDEDICMCGCKMTNKVCLLTECGTTNQAYKDGVKIKEGI